MRSLNSIVLIASALLVGCASLGEKETDMNIPKNTQLAISPNGEKLVVSWNEKSGKLRAKLFDLKDGDVVSTSEIDLPEDTLTTAFSRKNDILLITTWDKKISKLIRMNVNDGKQDIILQGSDLLRFPLEMSDNRYAFLGGIDQENRLSKWQSIEGNERKTLNPRTYSMAAPLNIINGALFLHEPSNSFRVIYGKLPSGLNAAISPDLFSIECADDTNLTCLKDKLKLTNLGYVSLMTFVSGSLGCDIPGEWIDTRELRISKDGSVVVFHAAIKDRNGPRALYLIKNNIKNKSECAAKIIYSSGV